MSLEKVGSLLLSLSKCTTNELLQVLLGLPYLQLVTEFQLGTAKTVALKNLANLLLEKDDLHRVKVTILQGHSVGRCYRPLWKAHPPLFI
jgi:hypothetical protein